MRDLLLPRTDDGVAIQLVVFIFSAVAALVLLRRQRDWLVLVTGLALVGVGLFGIRALH